MNSSLPKEWKWMTLGELCLDKEGLRRGPFGSAIRKEFFVPKGYKVYEQSNAIYDDAFRGKYFLDEKKYQELINFNVQPGDLIVSCSGTLGKIAEIPNTALPGVINQALLRVRLKKDIIDKKYFLYNFRSAQFQKKIFDQSQGTAMSNLVGIKDFKLIEIFLPPKTIQQSIVSKIEELFSELDKSIENLDLAQQQLKTYRQAVLKWAFEGKLTNENVKKGILPKGWKWKTIKEITSLLGDGLHGTPNYAENGDYYFINGNNLSDGKIIFKKSTKRVGSSEYQKHKKVLNETTILVSINGTLGNTAFYNGEKVILGKSACYFNLTSEADKQYIRYILTSQRFLNYATETATGSTIPNVSLKAMREFKIPLPLIDEQKKIVQEIESRLSVADKMEETIIQSLQQAEALRQSIFKKAFEGKLIGQL
jgi:type I restriction enzyme S subunit